MTSYRLGGAEAKSRSGSFGARPAVAVELQDAIAISDPKFYHHTAILWTRLEGALADGRPDR